MNYISLFSGAGGLDIGLERAGLQPICLTEIEPVFCRTLESNQGWNHSDGRKYLANARIINGDVRELSAQDLFGGADPDLVVGGPPCQAFSSAGKQLSVLDPRGALINQFYRLVGELRPKMFLLENVRGIVTARDFQGEPGGVITELVSILEGLGYSCRAALLNSADYGSHQRRVRCFILGSRSGTAPDFPPATHDRQGGLLAVPWKSLRDFLEHHADGETRRYTKPTPRLMELLQDIPDGSGLKSAGAVETTRPGGHWGYRQGTFIADLSLPARTVTGSTSQDWVRWAGVLRRLTLNEVKSLQGFPSDWVVEGSKAQQYKQIGNAVPTVFGEVIGAVIAEHLSNFPLGAAPVKIPLPTSFTGYIDYTKRDHSRNHEARRVHRNFSQVGDAVSEVRRSKSTSPPR